MDLTAPLLNEILEIFQQFGMRRATSVETRWQVAFPETTPYELGQWRCFCEEVERFALGLAHQVQQGQLNERSALQTLSIQYPDLTPKRIGDTYSQAWYFASQ